MALDSVPAEVSEARSASSSETIVEAQLAEHRELVVGKLLSDLPSSASPYLYDLVSEYPSRPAKALRPALCLATCRALGGDASRALNSAVAIELFHNAFLIHDDLQDQSERRRNRPTLQVEYGVAVALNVGNATNLVALQRLMENRWLLGPKLSWRIMQETELMIRHSLEGQAIELGWIRDNVCDLDENDYYRMCLKKTSWYTCIYPCRVGAVVAAGGNVDTAPFDRYGWYLGAAFQIQDDILNLVGDYARYGKEIGGDLWEGKRTLMLTHLLRSLSGRERRRVERFLAQSRQQRQAADVAWLRQTLIDRGCIDRARQYAQQLSAAAHREGLLALAGLPDSNDRDFLLALPAYVVERDR
ncbi:MAG: polyprenyl synthetase family protein [Candidatus Dormibacteraeota bacterium]|nr:polyprenyl synthetase family protein [Candidatus Dormibacteraeota bacterium]